MWGDPVNTVEEWIAREAEWIKLDAALRRPDGSLSWIGGERPLSDEDRQFLDGPPEHLPALVLAEWPRARQASVLLHEVVPAFATLFSDVEEMACLWPADAPPEEAASLAFRRPNPKTGEQRGFVFGPGASAEVVADMEALVGMPFPEPLRALYGTLGFLQGGGAALHEGLIGLDAGIAVGNVIAEREEWIQWCREVGGEDDLDTAAFADFLPVYANGEGDYIAWLGRGRDPKEPEMWNFSHDTLELYQGTRTLPRFLDKLLKTVYLGKQEAFEFDC